MYNISELTAKTLEDLQSIAKSMGISKIPSFTKDELVYKILDQQAEVAATSPKRETKSTKTRETKKSLAASDKNDNKPTVQPQPKRMVSRKTKQKAEEAKEVVLEEKAKVKEDVAIQNEQQKNSPVKTLQESEIVAEVKNNSKRGRKSIAKNDSASENKTANNEETLVDNSKKDVKQKTESTKLQTFFPHNIYAL